MPTPASPRRALRLFVLIAVAGLTGCSSDDDESHPCVDDDSACGTECDEALRPCGFGLYCDDGVCAKQCVTGDADACGGTGCPPNGRCPDSAPTGGGAAATSSGSGGSAGASGVPSDVCADSLVQASRFTPTVMLIVDQSSSMNEDFGGAGSRWNVLRDFLLQDPGGLIQDLQSQVRFGLALYSAESGGNAPDPIGECPIVTTVQPALDNFGAIQNVYSGAEPIEDTPTGDAVDAVLDQLDLAGLDADGDPIVFIIATDGEPDRCEELDPQNGQAEAVAAVERAYGLGVRTFIISVGEGNVSAQHQQDMANAGLGRGPGDEPAEYWVAGDDQSLRTALTDIVGGQLGCEVALNGRVESGDPCLGEVVLNGDELGCGEPDGWELVDPRHIRLLGAACERLKSDSTVMLDVSFPCEVGVVF